MREWGGEAVLRESGVGVRASLCHRSPKGGTGPMKRVKTRAPC